MSPFSRDAAECDRIRRALVLEIDLGDARPAFDVMNDLVTHGKGQERALLGPFVECWKTVRAASL